MNKILSLIGWVGTGILAGMSIVLIYVALVPPAA